MRGRRNQRNARNRMTRLGNHFIYLESRKLSTFTRFSTLCYLNLNFFGIHQVFSGYTETSGSDLFGLTAQGNAIVGFMETVGILSSFTRITTGVQLVHGQCHGFMRLFTDRTKRHGARYKMLYNFLYRLYIFQWNRITVEREEVTQEYRTFLFIYPTRIFLELSITSQTSGQLQSTDSFRIPGMLLAILTVGELTDVRQQIVDLFCKTCIMERLVIFGNAFQSDTSNG